MKAYTYAYLRFHVSLHLSVQCYVIMFSHLIYCFGSRIAALELFLHFRISLTLSVEEVAVRHFRVSGGSFQILFPVSPPGNGMTGYLRWSEHFVASLLTSFFMDRIFRSSNYPIQPSKIGSLLSPGPNLLAAKTWQRFPNLEFILLYPYSNHDPYVEIVRCSVKVCIFNSFFVVRIGMDHKGNNNITTHSDHTASFMWDSVRFLCAYAWRGSAVQCTCGPAGASWWLLPET